MVRVKLFANLREIVGKNEVIVGADTVGELLDKLLRMYPQLKPYMSYTTVVVNCVQVKSLDHKLKDDDVVALLPPFSGG